MHARLQIAHNLSTMLHSEIYGTTVAIFTKMGIFQFCVLQWVTIDVKRPKKVGAKSDRKVCWSSLSTAS